MLQIFIINSFSGDETTTIGIREELEKIKDMEYLVFNSEYPGHEGEMARQMCNLFPEEKIRFYACGGTGTFRNILKGVPEEDLGRVEIAEAAYGLTNDFLNIYGEEREKFKDFRNFIAGKVQPLDYLQTSIGPAHNTVSLGLDGLILRGVLHLKKLPFCKGRVPYFISSGLAILSTRTLDLEIEADGEIFSGRYCEVAFGNGNLLGGNFHFGGEADPTDGKMKMILVPGRGFFYKMKMLFAAILNRQEVLENSSSWRMVSEAKIRNKEGVPLSINVDGELEIAEEFTIRVNRGGMQFVEPKDIDRSNITWKKKVDLRYALPWIIMGCIMLVLDVFPQLLGKMATLLGFELPINMLFFLGVCLALAILFMQTVAISNLSEKVKKLTQEEALMNKTVDDKIKKREEK